MTEQRLAETLGKRWQAVSQNPAVVAADWEEWLQFIIELLQAILPLLAVCPMNPVTVRARAATMHGIISGTNGGGFVDRLRTRVWQWRFRRQVSTIVDNRVDQHDLQVASLLVISEMGDEDLLEVIAMGRNQ